MKTAAAKTELVVVCGPTGIGKTSLAIDLARCFGGEIVGADAMQIYRHMDIGTAKPTAQEQAAVRHHLVDVVDPDEPFDAARFRVLAEEAVGRIAAAGRQPFVVGGTGLYIKALVNGLFQAPPVDPRIRLRLQGEAERDAPALYRRLEEVDPVTAARVHPNDTFRVVRALEILETTGIPLSRHHENHRFKNDRYRVFKILLTMDRQELYARIDQRVEMMVAAGLVDEVRTLLGMGYAETLKPMQAIGYRHMVDYLQGRTGWEESVETLKRDTRRYAKRQFTWFRADAAMHTATPQERPQLENRIRSFLQPGNGEGRP